MGVARNLVVRALAQAAGLDAKVLAQRMMGYTDKQHTPSAAAFTALTDPDHVATVSGQPYPFYLAHLLQADVATLGDRADWLVEWKWDGIRAQFVRRGGEAWLWSRGEDLLNGRFPEIDAAHGQLPDHTVLDGEIVVWRDGRVMPFAQLQQRIGRKNAHEEDLADLPVAFLAYDAARTRRARTSRPLPQRQRRERLGVAGRGDEALLGR